jgi:hypothetical protein
MRVRANSAASLWGATPVLARVPQTSRLDRRGGFVVVMDLTGQLLNRRQDLSPRDALRKPPRRPAMVSRISSTQELEIERVLTIMPETMRQLIDRMTPCTRIDRASHP